MDGATIGITGGSGGVGASRLAVAVAAAAPGPALLLDLDPVGGGLDVLLGIEHRPGARWSDLQVAGGRLDPEQLTQRLPRWGDVLVLAADAGAPSALAVRQVLAAAGDLGALVVLDLPRAAAPARDAVAAQLSLTVLLARGDPGPLAAARAVAAGLPTDTLGTVVRRGPVPAAEAASFVGAPLLGVLPRRLGRPDRVPPRPPRPLRRVAAGLVCGLLGGRSGDPR